MGRVRVVTDSTADLSPEIAESLDIVVIPVTIGFGHERYRDHVILTTYMADVTTPDQRDLAFSIFFTVAFGVGSLWPTLLGYIADNYGLVATFVAMAVTYIVAGAAPAPIREHKQVS